MPKVVAYTPPWLSQPSSGARIFSDPEAVSPPSPSKKPVFSQHDGADSGETCVQNTKIAHRGTEVFTVVGNKIRWADLSRVKEDWEQQNHKRSEDQAGRTTYRTLKTGIYYQITGLSVSPSQYFLAISTTHTVHVAILPDSMRLHDADGSEIKLKTYQLGPTTHVIPEAPLASVLWHPLAAASPATDCLVTVTTEAAVRVWEFERTNHWSFERPALAIDMRKLADGQSSDQDFEPDAFGTNRGFSVDEFDMEAAAACFGGRGLENEDPWASMTLWTTMANGDVYALCPLLPSKWIPTSTTIPALTTAAVAHIASLSDEDVDPDERRAANQRYEWVQELDDEEFTSGAGAQVSICARPSNPSAIPRLQGPFELSVDLATDDTQVSDILVIPANLDEDDIFSGEDDYETVGGAKSLPFTVVCLATTDDKLYAMVELEGVTGQWLPKKGRSFYSAPTWDAGEFVLLETLSLQETSQKLNSQPSFTLDPANPYRFFITTRNSVVSISLEDWASNIGIEVSGQAESDGILTRLRSACQGSICTKTSLITHDKQDPPERSPLSTAILLEDVNIGTLLLTSSSSRAVAAQLDQSNLRTSQLLTNDVSFTASTNAQSPFRASRSLMQVIETNPLPIVAPPTRAPYAPSSAFYQNQMMPYQQLISSIDPHRRPLLREHPIRLSPACLNIMTQAHKTFSTQTSHLEKAAAEVFRRCQILKEELADQVRQMVELADRLNRLKTGDDADDIGKSQDVNKPHSEQISDRIEAAKTRQAELFHRYERVRRKAGMAGHAKQELSIKERAWIDEVDMLAKHVGVQDDISDTTRSQARVDSLSKRLETAKTLTAELVSDAKKIQQQTAIATEENRPESADITDSSPGPLRTSLRASVGGGGISRFQREKVAQVMAMVEREQAVIKEVQARLADLGIKV